MELGAWFSLLAARQGPFIIDSKALDDLGIVHGGC